MDESDPAEEVADFVASFADALVRRDEAGCAAHWGRAGMVLADLFETTATDPAQLEPFLARAWPIYDFLDLARIDHHIVERVALTASITRVGVRYSFYDSTGAHLTDGLSALADQRGYLPT